MCLIKIYCKIRANWKYILRVRFDFCVIKYLRNLWITTGVLPEYFLSGRIQTFRVQQTPSSSPFFSAVRNHLAVYWWRKIIHKFIKRQLNDTYRMLVKSQKCYIHWIWVKNENVLMKWCWSSRWRELLRKFNKNAISEHKFERFLNAGKWKSEGGKYVAQY